MNARTRQIVFPLFTAMIWGFAFVAQKSGSDYLGSFGFNGTRYVLSVLTPAIFVALRARRHGAPSADGAEPPKTDRRMLLRGGFVVGTVLIFASALQQYGIARTSVSKSGFLTALYIVLVPLFGLLLGKRVRALVWCGVAISVAGLYLLNFKAGGQTAMEPGDVYVLLSAFVFAMHILAIDHFTRYVDGAKLACVQFAVAAAEGIVIALLFEGLTFSAIAACLPHLLYTGLVSGGLGYTLQILAQQGSGEPAIVSLLLSLESLFAVVDGAIFLHERLTPREYLGCALMLCAAVLVQLPEKKLTKSAKLG